MNRKREYDARICGAIIRQYRVQKGYTYEQLAARIGVSDRFVRMIENGEKYMSVDTIIRVSKTINVSTDILFGLADILNTDIAQNIDIKQ